MFLFVLACLYVMAAALVLEATSEEGVLAVRPRVWFLVLAALGVCSWSSPARLTLPAP